MTSPLARPWPNTYWLPGGTVLCGEYPGDRDPAKAAEKLTALARFGVSVFVDLTTSADHLEPYAPIAFRIEGWHMSNVTIEGVAPPANEVHQLPIDDLNVPSTSRMVQILDVIDDAVGRGRTVYVHCWGGVGRTGTVAGCWLRRHGAGPDEALKMLEDRWKTVGKFRRTRQSPETDEQRSFVREWKERPYTHRHSSALDREQRYRGALLGGAVGDALGAPVEFMTLEAIQQHFGKMGITNLSAGRWPLGSITDDTQLTMFTAEALVRCVARVQERGLGGGHTWVASHAYRRWLYTQGVGSEPESDVRGWLVDRPELHHRRSPGKTCLEEIPKWTRDTGLTNTSKGCGAVMRSAPGGLFLFAPPESAYEYAVDLAQISHHHPEGYVAAGVFAVLIAHLRFGTDPLNAARRALGIAALHRHEAPLTALLLERAIQLAPSGQPPTPAQIASLGLGWVAEEALAIAVYCALSANGDFATGVRMAVNHSGDSDSTGAMCGNILGTALGVDAIPKGWIAKVEARDVIVQLADDMATGWRAGDDWSERYPPN